MVCASGSGRGETKDTARIDRLERQTTGHQRIEDAVERHPVDGPPRRIVQTRLEVGMAQRPTRRMQRVEYEHSASRYLDAGSTDQRRKVGGGRHARMKP